MSMARPTRGGAWLHWYSLNNEMANAKFLKSKTFGTETPPKQMGSIISSDLPRSESPHKVPFVS